MPWLKPFFSLAREAHKPGVKVSGGAGGDA